MPITRRRIITLMVVALLPLITFNVICAQQPIEKFRVFGYYACYTELQKQGELSFSFDDIDKPLTDVGWFSIWWDREERQLRSHRDDKGKGCDINDPRQTEFVKIAHEREMNALLVLGGDDQTQREGFRHLTENATDRATFIREVVRIVTAHGYDGVDLDWEFPNGTPDHDGFRVLIQELREALPQPYLISVVAPASGSFADSTPVEGVVDIIDWYNLMVYFLSGPWDDKADHNAPLHEEPPDLGPDQDPSLYPNLVLSVESSVQKWLARGVPREKLVVGLAFFGYQHYGARALGGPPGRDTGTKNESDSGPIPYWRILNQGRQVHRDPIARVPYYQDNVGWFTSFDDAQSIAEKCIYIRYGEGLGGAFVWLVHYDEITRRPLMRSVSQYCAGRRAEILFPPSGQLTQKCYN